MSEHKLNCKRIIDDLPVIQSIFSSKEEAIEYCKKFQKIGEFWTLYHVAQFCYFFERMKDAYKYIGEYSRILMDVDRLIMMASIVELLNSKEDFVRFDKWVKQEGKNDELRRRGVNVWHEYNRIHGSAEKFRAFFSKYLTKDEKIKLMKSVQFLGGEGKEFFPLFCFKGAECHVNHSYCTFDRNKEKCPVYVSEKRMSESIRECANFLYEMRSKFVHEAKLFLFPKPLPEGVGGSSSLFDYIEYRFTRKDYFHKGLIKLELFSNQFTELVKKYLKKLMQRYTEKIT